MSNDRIRALVIANLVSAAVLACTVPVLFWVAERYIMALDHYIEVSYALASFAGGVEIVPPALRLQRLVDATCVVLSVVVVVTGTGVLLQPRIEEWAAVRARRQWLLDRLSAIRALPLYIDPPDPLNVPTTPEELLAMLRDDLAAAATTIRARRHLTYSESLDTADLFITLAEVVDGRYLADSGFTDLVHAAKDLIDATGQSGDARRLAWLRGRLRGLLSAPAFQRPDSFF